MPFPQITPSRVAFWLSVLCAAILSFSLGAATLTQIDGCIEDLSAPRGYRLGIGVLGQTDEGHKYLAVGPYAGSLHRSIFQDLSEAHPISHLLWLGELRYQIDSVGNIQIFEANETSGFFRDLLAAPLAVEGRELNVQNLVGNVPEHFRAADFAGYSFDQNNLRLARELSEVKDDVRHSIGNSLQLISSAVGRLGMPISPENKDAVVALVRERGQNSLVLVRWLVLNLIEDSRIKPEDVSALLSVLAIFGDEQRPASEFDLIDKVELDREIQVLAQAVNPANRTIVTIFPVPR